MPIFDNLDRFHHFCCSVQNFSIDEVIILHNGIKSSKQFIREETIRYGYKVKAIFTSDEFGAMLEPDSGKDTKIDNFQLGQSPNFVLGFVKKMELLLGTGIFFDNLNIYFPLYWELSVTKTLEVQEFCVKTVSINKTCFTDFMYDI